MTHARGLAGWIAVVLAVVLCGLARFDAPPPALVLADAPRSVAIAPVDAPPTIDELRARIAEILAQEEVPGVGLALVDRDGVRWAGGVGVADLASGTPVTGDTVFRVASITKSIVGLGVARLQAQGRIDVDAPLALPGAHAESVTLAHALEHTAGFDDMRFNEWFAADEDVTPAAALAINPRSRVLRWRPGSRVAYSNVGYTVAGLAIERATGEPFDAWLHREILVPLGMARAGFRRTDDLRARLATGYRTADRVAPFIPIAHRPAGALLASPRDLGKLVHFLLRRGEGLPAIVPPEAIDRIERAGTAEFPRTDIQYGWGNYGDVGHAAPARGHDGGLPGFYSCYRYFPSLGVGYVMLLNSSHSARAFDRIRALLFAHLARGRALPEPPRAREDAAAWVGHYGFASPRHALFGFLERALLGWDASVTADGLALQGTFGGPIELVATGEGGFRHPRESGTSVRFGRDRDGRRVMAAGLVHAQESSATLARLRIYALVGAKLLLDFAPLWAFGWLVVRLVRRRGLAHVGLVVWPAVCGACLVAMQLLLIAALEHDVAGVVHPLTIGLCATTIGFALASAVALATALRIAVAADRPSFFVRSVPTLAAVSAFALTLWLGAHGIIGLRTWAW